MKVVFFILVVLLITQIGFWSTLGAILGAALMFVLLAALAVGAVILGGVILLAAAFR